MSTEPEPTPRKKRARPKPGPEDFFIFEVDGFAQMTPEQKMWPVVYTGPKPPPQPADGTEPPPPKQ